MKVGLIGYGAIGQLLARTIEEGGAGDASLVSVMTRSGEPPAGRDGDGIVYTNSLDRFLATGMDLVIEAAAQEAVRAYAALVLARGADLMVMSLGAFADTDLLEALSRLAHTHRRRIYLPSGAIGGLDALAAAALDEIDEVTLTTTKPVSGLAGARSAIDPALDLDTIGEATCLFEGPAAEAVRLFPKNVNVAAALSLAGIGFERTTVRVVADPRSDRNVHRIEARGRFGELSLEFRLLPSPANPRTSYLAALSAVRMLRSLTATVKVGS